MKALIIDDEINCREVISSYIDAYFPSIITKEEADSVETGLEAIARVKPDLVFLDIQLHQRDSFELLDELEEINFKIIFTTAFDNYAIKAFEYGALHYLLKPLTPSRFTAAVERCINDNALKQTENVQRVKNFYLKTVNTTHNIIFDEVLFIEADGSYSTIYNVDGSDLFASKKLGDFAEILPDYFFRIHNSIIVNINYVRLIKGKENLVQLMNDKELSISRRKKKAFREALENVNGLNR